MHLPIFLYTEHLEGPKRPPPRDLGIGRCYELEIFTSGRYGQMEMIYKILGRPPVWLVFYRPECQIGWNHELDDWLGNFCWNLPLRAKLSNKSNKWRKKVGPIGIWYFTDRSVKYTLTPLRNSGTTGAFDMKFSTVIDIDHLRRCEEFQIDRSRGSYFTDRSVFYLKCSLSGQPPVRFR